MSLELSLISFLRDDQLRSIFIRHIQPELVVEDISRILLNALKRSDTSDLGLILAELKKSLTDKEVIFDIMETISKVEVPMKLSSFEKAARELESYIRWRKTITQVNYMASQNLDSIMPVTSQEKLHYERLLEAIQFSVDLDDSEDTYDFTKLEDYERAKLKAAPTGKSYKSRYQFINQSLQSSGFVAGELTMVVAPPGVGKSTMMASEGVGFISQGSKVLHYVLGDLNPQDINNKYIASLMKKSLNRVILENDSLMKLEKVQDMFSRARFRVKDTYEMDVDEIFTDALRMKDKFDYEVLIIDYDGNIRPSYNENMYQEGGYTYGRLRQLSTKLECTTLIGCQPKITSWRSEIIGLDAASESSRKQHHVDNMITLSQPDSSIPVGVMHLAKARRGKDGTRNCICYLNECSTIIEISYDEYKMIKDWYKENIDLAYRTLRQWSRDQKGIDIAA